MATKISSYFTHTGFQVPSSAVEHCNGKLSCLRWPNISKNYRNLCYTLLNSGSIYKIVIKYATIT